MPSRKEDDSDSARTGNDPPRDLPALREVLEKNDTEYWTFIPTLLADAWVLLHYERWTTSAILLLAAAMEGFLNVACGVFLGEERFAVVEKIRWEEKLRLIEVCTRLELEPEKKATLTPLFKIRNQVAHPKVIEYSKSQGQPRDQRKSWRAPEPSVVHDLMVRSLEFMEKLGEVNDKKIGPVARDMRAAFDSLETWAKKPDARSPSKKKRQKSNGR